MHQTAVAFLCDHNNVFIGHHPAEAIVGHLNQRSSRTENVEELFGLCFSAHGPKTTSNATSHDDCVSVRIFQIKGGLKAMKRARKRLTIVGNRISGFAVAAGNLSIEKPLQGELRPSMGGLSSSYAAKIRSVA
jgi:hypothetical protein